MTVIHSCWVSYRNPNVFSVFLQDRVFEKSETNLFIEHEILTDLICERIRTDILSSTKLSGSQWNWIWTSIGGRNTLNISTADGFFDAIRQHNALGFNNADSNFLLPAPVVCSHRRLCKIEAVYCGKTTVNQLECYPFDAVKLLTTSSTSR